MRENVTFIFNKNSCFKYEGGGGVGGGGLFEQQWLEIKYQLKLRCLQQNITNSAQ